MFLFFKCFFFVFFIIFKVLPKFQELSCSKLYILHNPHPQGQFSGTKVFNFALKSTRERIALHLFGKRFCAIFFCFHAIFWRSILWLELRIYSQGVWAYNKFENVIHELRWSANFNFEDLSHKFLQILIPKFYF